MQETYAAIDPIVLAAKKQKKAKAKTANRKNKQAQEKPTTSHAENQNNMPDQKEAYQVRKINSQFKIIKTVHSKRLLAPHCLYQFVLKLQ